MHNSLTTTHMRTILLFCFFGILGFENGFSQDGQVCIPQTYTKWVDSKFVGDKFLIKCFIPNQKAIPVDSLPIVFVLDADLAFEMAFSILRWLRITPEERLPNVAIIGISYSTGGTDWWNKRSRDYTPSKDTTKIWGDFPLAGGAEKFKKFIKEELFKIIEDEYHLKSKSKTLIGISFGGLFATHVLFTEPELFKNYVILAPAVAWNSNEVFEKELSYSKTHSTLSANVYTAVGTLDDKTMTEPWKKFMDQVKSRNYKGLNLETWLAENEAHLSLMPGGMTRGLKYALNKK
jgi:uncharacterized protein